MLKYAKEYFKIYVFYFRYTINIPSVRSPYINIEMYEQKLFYYIVNQIVLLQHIQFLDHGVC